MSKKKKKKIKKATKTDPLVNNTKVISPVTEKEMKPLVEVKAIVPAVQEKVKVVEEKPLVAEPILAEWLSKLAEAQRGLVSFKEKTLKTLEEREKEFEQFREKLSKDASRRLLMKLRWREQKLKDLQENSEKQINELTTKVTALDQELAQKKETIRQLQEKLRKIASELKI